MIKKQYRHNIILKNEIPIVTPRISLIIENLKKIYDSKWLIGRRFKDRIELENLKYWV